MNRSNQALPEVNSSENAGRDDGVETRENGPGMVDIGPLPQMYRASVDEHLRLFGANQQLHQKLNQTQRRLHQANQRIEQLERQVEQDREQTSQMRHQLEQQREQMNQMQEELAELRGPVGQWRLRVSSQWATGSELGNRTAPSEAFGGVNSLSSGAGGPSEVWTEDSDPPVPAVNVNLVQQNADQRPDVRNVRGALPGAALLDIDVRTVVVGRDNPVVGVLDLEDIHDPVG
ncbi:hypothetical protein VTL71DRAFT_5982 [Oculimacula yallundae]|uniref:Uncharacterized protein n=1 Tax=Oculimacula yallundae TaxID=86028 RepID=A0ABR4BZ15_9HELO